MTKCEPRSKIYTDCINALQYVEEIGRLTLDDARTVGNTSEPALGCGWQASGRQGHGGCQPSQCHTSSWRPTSGRYHTLVPTFGQCHTPVPTSSRHHTPVHDHTTEEASQTTFEICLDTSYDMGSMAYDDVGPSHRFAHGDTYRSPSTSSTTSPLPTTRMSLLLTTRTTLADVYGRDKMRFMPTPSDVPLEFVNTKYPTIQVHC